MKLFTQKSITVFLVLILLATVFTFFQNKNVVKFDNGKTVIVDKYNNNAEVKIEKGSTLGDILDLIVKIMEYIADFIDSVIGGGGSDPTPPGPGPSPVSSYLKEQGGYYVIKNYERYQDIGRQGDGECTWYAMAYAQRIRTGSNRDPKSKGDQTKYGLTLDDSHHNTCSEDGLKDFYNDIRSRLKEGKPVVVYVGYTNSKGEKGNHNLTVVGIKKSVYSADKSKLDTSSFLAIDPWDSNTDKTCNMYYKGGSCAFTKREFYVNSNGKFPNMTCVMLYAKQ